MAQKLAEVDELYSIFTTIDLDNNGYIDGHEFQILLQSKGFSAEACADADALLKDIDPDDDGKLFFNEFLEVMDQTGWVSSHKATGTGQVAALDHFLRQANAALLARLDTNDLRRQVVTTLRQASEPLNKLVDQAVRGSKPNAPGVQCVRLSAVIVDAAFACVLLALAWLVGLAFGACDADFILHAWKRYGPAYSSIDIMDTVELVGDLADDLGEGMLLWGLVAVEVLLAFVVACVARGGQTLGMLVFGIVYVRKNPSSDKPEALGMVRKRKGAGGRECGCGRMRVVG